MFRDITWQRVSLPGWPTAPLVALVGLAAAEVDAGMVSLRLGATAALLAWIGSAPSSA